jgi:hypothetical protein
MTFRGRARRWLLRIVLVVVPAVAVLAVSAAAFPVIRAWSSGMSSGRPAAARSGTAGTASSALADELAAAHARRACAPAGSGHAACLALVRTNVPELAQAGLSRGKAPYGIGYGPVDLRAAYNVTAASVSDGSGATVAVIGAYDDPNAAADLAVYRADWGLPACVSGTGAGCLTKVNASGAASPLPGPAGKTGWATEESLDVDVVAAICPRCRILLVEASSAAQSDLGDAVNTAVRIGARFVVTGYGGPESYADPAYDLAYYNHAGVAITAAAGDSGYGVSYPAASRYITSVGGTSLIKTVPAAKGAAASSSNARGWTETVWSGTGSGCATDEAKTPWQADGGCTSRAGNDVAAVADPGTGIAVYDSYDQRGWLEAGGTSVSSALIASVYALAGPPAAGSYPSSYPYAHRHAAGLYDVTGGSDGSCHLAYLCGAGAGYDGPTGMGSPDGVAAFGAR